MRPFALLRLRAHFTRRWMPRGHRTTTAQWQQCNLQTARSQAPATRRPQCNLRTERFGLKTAPPPCSRTPHCCLACCRVCHCVPRRLRRRGLPLMIIALEVGLQRAPCYHPNMQGCPACLRKLRRQQRHLLHRGRHHDRVANPETGAWVLLGLLALLGVRWPRCVEPRLRGRRAVPYKLRLWRQRGEFYLEEASACLGELHASQFRLRNAPHCQRGFQQEAISGLTSCNIHCVVSLTALGQACMQKSCTSARCKVSHKMGQLCKQPF